MPAWRPAHLYEAGAPVRGPAHQYGASAIIRCATTSRIDPISVSPAPGAQPLRSDDDLQSRLIDLAGRFSGHRVAVIGDVICDRFLYGDPSRISRESPVLILDYAGDAIVPGGAANAAGNVATLGGHARLAGLIGRGNRDRRLLRALHGRVDRAHLVHPSGYRAPVKTRILAGSPHTARQQVVRIDHAADMADPAAAAGAFEDAALASLAGCDAVLVSDYGSGLVTPALFRTITAAVGTRGRRCALPVLIDSRHHLAAFRGATACTPNESEAERLAGVRIGDDPAALERAGRAILRKTAAEGVVITRGSRGMALFAKRRPTEHIPIHGSDEVTDVTGAGDTVIATLTLALAAGASLSDGVRLANYAGGLVVMKRGTATVSGDELIAAIRAD